MLKFIFYSRFYLYYIEWILLFYSQFSCVFDDDASRSCCLFGTRKYEKCLFTQIYTHNGIWYSCCEKQHFSHSNLSNIILLISLLLIQDLSSSSSSGINQIYSYFPFIYISFHFLFFSFVFCWKYCIDMENLQYEVINLLTVIWLTFSNWISILILLAKNDENPEKWLFITQFNLLNI